MKKRSKLSSNCFQIDEPLFNERYLFCWGMDKEMLIKVLRHHGIPLDFSEYPEFRGFVSRHDNVMVIYVKPDFDSSDFPYIFAHEIVHAVNQTFLKHQVQLDTGNDEFQAYYTDFLFRYLWPSRQNRRSKK